MKKWTLISLFFFTLSANAELLGQSLVDTILQDGLVVSPNSDAASVKTKLGKPLQTSTKEIKNKYSARNDKIEALYYKDLKIYVYTLNNPEYQWSKVSQVVVSSNLYNIPIRIGLTKPDVVELLGDSAIIKESSWFYFPSKKEPHLQLIIKFNGNRVSEVIWSHMP